MVVASQAIGTSSVTVRIGTILREIVRGGLAGALAGLLVGGLGGRVVMRIAALMNPDAAGALTGNGEVVGVISLNGTLALAFFGGLGMGLAAGVVWVIVSPWLPGTGRVRGVVAAIAVVALGAMFLIERGNRDFDILGPDPVILAMLLALVAAMGAAIAWLDDRLERRLPAVGVQRSDAVAAYAVVAALGALLLIPTITLYVEHPCFCEYPPELTGWSLVAVGVVTAAWWTWRAATGRSDRPRALVVAGRALLLLALSLGTISLARNVSEILAAG